MASLAPEAQPLESEPFYRLLLGSISDAVFVTDDDGCFTFICPNAHVIFGYTDAEIAEMGRAEALFGLDALPAALPADGGEVRNLERVVRDKGGVEHVLLLNVKRVYLRGGTTLITCRDISARKQTEQRMASCRRRLQSLAAQVGLSAERERRRVAAALHDVVGQKLAAAKMRLALMGDQPDRQALAGVISLLDELIGDCRHLTFELSPPVLHELGLSAALEWLAEYAEREWRMAVRVSCVGADRIGPGPLRVTVFGAARELLRNAAEHGKADTAELALEVAGSRCVMSVTDDGVGFKPSELDALASGERGWGLFNMRVQAEHVGGHLRIHSRPGHGTTVTFAAPLRTDGGASAGDVGDAGEGGVTDDVHHPNQLGVDERCRDEPDSGNTDHPCDAG